MQPFNVTVTGTADDLREQLHSGVDAVLADANTDSDSDNLARRLVEWADDLATDAVLGTDVTDYQAVVQATSDPSDPSRLHGVALYLSAVTRGVPTEGEGGGEPAAQV